MAELGRLLVGYRAGSRMIYKLRDEYGLAAVEVRQCVAGCGYPVHFVASGYEKAWESDAQVICEQCFAEHRYEIEASQL